MRDNVFSLETARAELELKRLFPSDYELVRAFYLAKRLHDENLGETDDALFCIKKDNMVRWLQKRLADEVETRGIRKASVYKMVPYVAEVLVSHSGIGTHEWRPTQVRREYDENRNDFALLRLAENCFVVFCLFPEEKARTSIRYRTYAYEEGTRAYREYGSLRRIALGHDMEEAFVPLGTLAREFLTPRS